MISDHVRSSDLAARIGGDEFAVLTVETTAGGLDVLARRLERALEEHAGIGASVGWARPTSMQEDPATLIHQADRAMYERKRQRRELSEGVWSAREKHAAPPTRQSQRQAGQNN